MGDMPRRRFVPAFLGGDDLHARSVHGSTCGPENGNEDPCAPDGRGGRRHTDLNVHVRSWRLPAAGSQGQEERQDSGTWPESEVAMRRAGAMGPRWSADPVRCRG